MLSYYCFACVPREGRRREGRERKGGRGREGVCVCGAGMGLSMREEGREGRREEEERL